MKYSIRLSPKAAKTLKKLPEAASTRIREELRTLRTNPVSQLKRLQGQDIYSFRIGEYRALIDIQEDLLLVRIIDHRKRIYKRFDQ